MGVAVLDNKMYAMGGTTGGMTLNSVECYDPVQNKWTNVTPMRIHRSGVGQSTFLALYQSDIVSCLSDAVFDLTYTFLMLQ